MCEDDGEDEGEDEDDEEEDRDRVEDDDPTPSLFDPRDDGTFLPPRSDFPEDAASFPSAFDQPAVDDGEGSEEMSRS
jgi:hypothetical protein